MKLLNGYTYRRLLGQSGHFGDVFLAKNSLTNEFVAIKHVDGDKLDMSMEAWSAEAQAMAACNHENLVQIKHAEITPDGPALVMEYITGGSWEGRYGGDAAPVRHVVDIGINLCWGLHHLHGNGLVHRDIKPGNVLLRGDSGVLGDFGLTGLNGTQPHHHYVAHTPPEARVSPVQWTPSADVYALGVTLYRMVCGDDFSGYNKLDFYDTDSVMDWPNRDHWPIHIHKKLKRVLRSAMNPVAANRPQTAAEFRSSLQSCRPLVSFQEQSPGYWVGDSDNERWTLELKKSAGHNATLTTRRDKGKGYRNVLSASITTPTKERDVRKKAAEVMDRLAQTGNINV